MIEVQVVGVEGWEGGLWPDALRRGTPFWSYNYWTNARRIIRETADD